MGQYLRGRRRPSPETLRKAAHIVSSVSNAREVVDELRELAGEATRTGSLRTRGPKQQRPSAELLLPPHAASAEHRHAVGLLLAARAYEHGERAQLAAQAYRSVAEISEELYPIALAALAWLHLRTRTYAQIQPEVEVFLAGGRRDVEPVDLLYVDGHAAEQLGDLARARERYTRVLAVTPTHRDAFLRWAALSGYTAVQEPPNGTASGVAGTAAATVSAVT
jgi:hypothetical protein